MSKFQRLSIDLLHVVVVICYVEMFTQKWRITARSTDWQILQYYNSFSHSIHEQSAVSSFRNRFLWQTQRLPHHLGCNCHRYVKIFLILNKCCQILILYTRTSILQGIVPIMKMNVKLPSQFSCQIQCRIDLIKWELHWTHGSRNQWKSLIQ